jgi:hypothetical protein
MKKMKTIRKNFILCCVSVGFSLYSCNDDMTNIGTSILSPSDVISVSADTFTLTAQTIRLDSVYAKTTQCLLGQMYDPLYGNIKADFICQFYCEENFKFAQTPFENKIDSMELVIWYSGSSWLGDSIIPMQVSVYEVDKPLKRNFYTNSNLENYCNMSQPLGKKTYTAYDLSFYDTLPPGGLYYTHNIIVKLPQELGQKFYDESIREPSAFSSQASFNQFFPGLYITTTFGSGNLIQTEGENVYLQVFYNYMSKNSEGVDTLIRTAEFFTNSKEVIQISRFENENMDELLVPNNTHTYIKSPAGVCTRLTVPTSEIEKTVDVKKRYINDFTLNLHYLPTEEWNYAYTPPAYMLLIPEDSVKTFFENEKVEDNISCFLSYQQVNSVYSVYGYDPQSRTYNFGNISALLKDHIEKSPGEDLRLLVLPVIRSYTQVQTNYYMTTGVRNSLTPGGVKIRTDGDYMKVAVISSEFENK